MHNQSLAERVTRHRVSLGAAGQRVADFILQNPAAALASSALDLATSAATSDATVIRTVKALGYAGLPELKQALVATFDGRATPADDLRRTLADMAVGTAQALDTVLNAHDEALSVLRAPAFREQLADAVSMLIQADRIVTFGIGPSSILAHYAAFVLARAGRRSQCLDAAGVMLADQMLDLRHGDAILALAYGRAYHEVTGLFAEARRLRLPIVLVSDTAAGKLAKSADRTIAIPRGKQQRVALHGGTLVGLEALALALAATDQDRAVATLDRLNILRAAVSGQKFEVG